MIFLDASSRPRAGFVLFKSGRVCVQYSELNSKHEQVPRKTQVFERVHIWLTTLVESKKRALVFQAHSEETKQEGCHIYCLVIWASPYQQFFDFPRVQTIIRSWKLAVANLQFKSFLKLSEEFYQTYVIFKLPAENKGGRHCMF